MEQTIGISLEQVESEWEKDAQTRIDMLKDHSLNLYKVHSKYRKMLNIARRIAKKYELELKKLTHLKRRYYKGHCTKEELEKYRWEQWPYTFKTKEELTEYLEVDPDILKMKHRMYENELITQTLEDILKMIHNRNFNLKLIHDIRVYEDGS